MARGSSSNSFSTGAATRGRSREQRGRQRGWDGARASLGGKHAMRRRPARRCPRAAVLPCAAWRRLAPGRAAPAARGARCAPAVRAACAAPAGGGWPALTDLVLGLDGWDDDLDLVGLQHRDLGVGEAVAGQDLLRGRRGPAGGGAPGREQPCCRQPSRQRPSRWGSSGRTGSAGSGQVPAGASGTGCRHQLLRRCPLGRLAAGWLAGWGAGAHSRVRACVRSCARISRATRTFIMSDACASIVSSLTSVVELAFGTHAYLQSGRRGVGRQHCQPACACASRWRPSGRGSVRATAPCAAPLR